MGLKLTSSCPFFYLFIFICLYNGKRLRRGFQQSSWASEGDSLGNTYCKQSSCCYVCRGTEIVQPGSYKINLEMSYGSATSIVREANNTIYFTREQFTVGLRFPIPSLVKRFFHFTRASPTLVHSNVFRILTGYSVLNSLY